MAITRIGTAGVGTSSATVPAHAIGDLILVYAFRNASTTAPSLATGFTSVLTKSGTSCSMRVGYKIATATNDTSGTWTNATETIVVVYRPSSVHSITVGASASNIGSTNTLNYPALTLQTTDGTSWVVGGAGIRSISQSLSTHPPTGMTLVVDDTDATAEESVFDTNAGVTSWASTNVTLTGTAAAWVSATVEIKDVPPVVATGTSAGTSTATASPPTPSWTVGTSQQSAAAGPTGIATIAMTKPTGTAAGDLLIAALEVVNTGTGDPGTVTLPSGWVLLDSTFVSGASAFVSDARGTLAWKIATSSEPSSYTFTWSLSTTRVAWWINNFTPPSGSPVFVTTTGVTYNNNNTYTSAASPALSGLGNTGNLILDFWLSPGGQSPYTMPSGITSIYNENNSNGGYGNIAVAAYNTLPSTSAASVNYTSSFADAYRAVTVAFTTTVQHVQSNGASNTSFNTSIAATLSPIGYGHAIVGFASLTAANSTSPTVSIADDKGNSYPLKSDIFDVSAGQRSVTFALGNITNGPQTFTATLGSSTDFLYIYASEYAGIAALSDPTDGFTGQVFSGSTSVTSGNVTTTQSGDVIWGSALASGVGSGLSAGTNETIRFSTVGSIYLEDKVQVSAGSVATQFTANNTSSAWHTFVVALKAAVTGSSGNTYAQTVTITSTSTTALLRTTGKIVLMTGSSTTTKNSGVSKSVSISSTSTVTKNSSSTKSISATCSSVVTKFMQTAKSFAMSVSSAVAKSLSAGKTVSASSSTAVQFVRSSLKSVSASVSSTTVFSRAVSKFISATGSTLASVTKTFPKVFSMSVSGTVASSRSISKTISTTSASVVQVLKSATKSVSASVSSSVSLVSGLAKLMAISIGVSTSTSLSRSVSKVVSIASSTSVALSRAVSKAVGIVSSTTTTLVKRVQKAVTTASTTSTSVVHGLASLVSVSVGVLSGTSVTRQVSKVVSAASSGSVSALRGISKGISSSVSSTASEFKTVGKRISTFVSSSASLLRSIQKSVSASVSTTVGYLKSVSSSIYVSASTIANVVAGLVTKTFVAIIDVSTSASVTLSRGVGKVVQASVSTLAGVLTHATVTVRHFAFTGLRIVSAWFSTSVVDRKTPDFFFKDRTAFSKEVDRIALAPAYEDRTVRTKEVDRTVSPFLLSAPRMIRAVNNHMTVLNWPPKAPSEVLDYSINWTERLDKGDAIANSSWTVSGTLVNLQAAFTNTISTIWMGGGTANVVPFKVSNQIQTVQGRIMDQSVYIKIIDK